MLFIWNGFCHAQPEKKPLIFGSSVSFPSAVLNEERTINIYLPESYHENDSVRYPVIYVLDGGWEEDFVHIAGLVRFNSQPWIARFPESIVVGIEGNNRRRDFTFAVTNIDFIEKEGFSKTSFPAYGGSGKYIQFLENELQPSIENMYRTSGKRTVIGESLAGLLCTEILLKQPGLFDDYIIISPSLWWGEEALLKGARKLLSQNLKRTVNVYIGAPDKEEDAKMYAEAEQLYKILTSNANINSVFDYMPDEIHSTVIHQAVYNAFKKLYPKTMFSR